MKNGQKIKLEVGAYYFPGRRFQNLISPDIFERFYAENLQIYKQAAK